MAYVVAIEGIDALKAVDGLDLRITENARIAVNYAVRRAQPAAKEEILNQVAFPTSYLNGENKRLYISRFASNDRLEAALAARVRPTSLARFVKGRVDPRERPNGLTVEVKVGRARFMRRAFVIKLRRGTALDESNFNLGLAIRTDGRRPSKAYRPVALANNLWLLYGPSVDQVFGGDRGAAVKIAPGITDDLEREFLRLMSRGNA